MDPAQLFISLADTVQSIGVSGNTEITEAAHSTARKNFLEELDNELEYKAGNANLVADALFQLKD